MVSRTLWVKSALLASLGASVLLASTLAATYADTHVRLGTDVLARSRGGSQNNVLGSLPCNTGLINNPPCTTQLFCNTCAKPNYIVVMFGANGGYFPNSWADGLCGNNWIGTCLGTTCVPVDPPNFTNTCPGKTVPAIQP
jgi:hypothetical protein